MYDRLCNQRRHSVRGDELHYVNFITHIWIFVSGKNHSAAINQGVAICSVSGAAFNVAERISFWEINDLYRLFAFSSHVVQSDVGSETYDRTFGSIVVVQHRNYIVVLGCGQQYIYVEPAIAASPRI